MKNLVSVIVPVFNSEKYLTRCLESLLTQTYDNIEIILINDGSTDRSRYYCEKYREQYDNVMFVDKKNEGPSASRNIGISCSRGEYIVFIDSDDYVEKGYIESLVSEIEKSNAGLAVCGYWRETSRKQQQAYIMRNNKVFDAEEGLICALTAKEFGGYPWNKLFRSEVIDKYQLRFECELKKSEDMLFVCEYIHKISKVVYVSEALYHYMFNMDSICRNTRFKQKFNEDELTNLKAHKMIHDTISNDNDNVKSAFKCRYVCTLMRLLVNLYYSNENRSELTKFARDGIRENIICFIKCDFFSIKEKVGAMMMAIEPRVFFSFYGILYTVLGIEI